MTKEEVDHAYRIVTRILKPWGESARGEREALGFPSTNILYTTMTTGLATRRSGPLTTDDDVMDLDRLIATLPEAHKQVLYVNYVQSGTVKQRVKLFGGLQRTYYRKLNAAKLNLFDLVLRAE